MSYGFLDTMAIANYGKILLCYRAVERRSASSRED